MNGAASGNYVRPRRAGPHLFRETMNSLESKLIPAVRPVHRSTIVNVEQIEELRSSSAASTVFLRNGAVTLSRGYRDSQERFEERLI